MNFAHAFGHVRDVVSRAAPIRSAAETAALATPDVAAITEIATRTSAAIAPIGLADARAGAALLGPVPARSTAAMRDARAAVQQVLATGDRIREVAMPGAQAGMNGTRTAFELGSVDGVTVTGVLKRYRDQAPQEILAARVADKLGISHLMPVIGARADASVMMQFAPGAPAGRAFVRDAATLEQALTRWYTDVHGMSATDAAARANLDRELVNVFDYVMANGDRHASNIMVDEKSRIVQLIDHGHIGWGQRNQGGTPELPVLQRVFMNSTEVGENVRRTTLSPATREYLAAIDTADLRTAHTSIMGLPNVEQMNQGMSGSWREVQHPKFADQMVHRFERARAEGSITFAEATGGLPPDMPPLRGRSQFNRFGFGGRGGML